MESVILTGATGFIGSHCINHLLESGFHVHALYNKQRPETELLKKDRLEWHQVDLLNQDQAAALIKKLAATHMLHLAWYAEPGKFWDSRLNLEWLRASVNLLKVFIESGGRRFVGAGSCAEYDWSGNGTMHEGKTPLNPSTLYGTSKSSLFQTAFQTTITSGAEFAWGRIFWLYGPGEDKRRLVPYVMNALLSDEDANCTDGTQERDYMYVEDVARAFAALVKSPVQGAVNIGTGNAISIKTLVDSIAKLLDKQDLLQMGAVPTDKNDPPLVVADANRLVNELKCTPEVSLDEGLRLTLEWWRKQRSRTSRVAH